MKQFSKVWLVATVLMYSGVSADWYRGNTHVHTELSGHGDSSPEYVAKWYHDRGYNFLILSEHNKFIDPQAVTLPDNARSDFLLIPGQEVTGKPIGIHTTAMNVPSLIPWVNQETDTKAMVISDQIADIIAAGGHPILNHPHGGSDVRSGDILPVERFQMMEIYNANTKRNNLFKRRYLNLPLTAEGLWDELLTAGRRVYGVGSDDAHTFQKTGPNIDNSGLGWVMVKADTLSSDAITQAMKSGDFYASNGVILKVCERGTDFYHMEIDTEKTRETLKTLPVWAGLETRSGEIGFRIEFIGLGGTLLKSVDGTSASFGLESLDTYVRARAVFTRYRSNGGLEEFFAWGQPAFAPNR